MKRNKKLYINLAYEVYKKPKICETCGKTEGKICVHHINENPGDNSEENLMILCDFCHKSLHNKGKILSYETRNKISKNNKGKISLIKGKSWGKHSVEAKIKIGLASLGNKYNLGKKISQEHKNKLSKSLKGKNSKKINQFGLNGNFIKTWNSFTEVNKYLGISIGNISSACNGKRKTAGGFIWEYYKKKSKS